jgi:hypothetical protein
MEILRKYHGSEESRCFQRKYHGFHGSTGCFGVIRRHPVRRAYYDYVASNESIITKSRNYRILFMHASFLNS